MTRLIISRLKIQHAIFLSFLVLAACATSKQEAPSDEDRILKYKKEYPGFELCLCNEPDLSNNLVTSRLYWQLKEKPICGNTKANTVRIIYTQSFGEVRLFRLSQKDSAYFLTRKYLEQKDRWDRTGGVMLHEAEAKLSSAEADSIFKAIDDFKAMEADKIVQMDGSDWKIEAMVNGNYSRFWIYGDHTEVDRNFMRFLLQIFSQVVAPK